MASDAALVHASPTFELLVAERLVGPGDDEREVVEASRSRVNRSRSSRADGERRHPRALQRRGLLMVTKSGQRVEVTLSHPLFGEVINLQLPRCGVAASADPSLRR